jgi:N6-adenosine-specific RNA methylase IME4
VTEKGEAVEKAAELAHVSRNYVYHYRKIQKADPALAEQVRAGTTKLDAAKQQLIRHELQNKTPPLPTGKYDLVVAEPPFRTSEQSDSRHPTMTVEELSAFPIQSVCETDCVLFVWVPAPQLASGLELIRRWGFTYRTGAVWDQGKDGTGTYFRSRHKHLLLATRGDPQTPDAANRPPSVITAPRTSSHREKPDAAYGLIERMYPHAKRLELFVCGRPRKNWSSWGNGIGRRAPN